MTGAIRAGIDGLLEEVERRVQDEAGLVGKLPNDTLKSLRTLAEGCAAEMMRDAPDVPLDKTSVQAALEGGLYRMFYEIQKLKLPKDYESRLWLKVHDTIRAGLLTLAPALNRVYSRGED